MVVTGCYNAVLSILLFLFGVNSGYLLCCVFSALEQNTPLVSVLSFACIIYLISVINIFNIGAYRYFDTNLPKFCFLI